MSHHMNLSSRPHVPPSRARALSVESVESLESRTLLNGGSLLAMLRSGHALIAEVAQAAASGSTGMQTLHASHSAAAAITQVAASPPAGTLTQAKAPTTPAPVAPTPPAPVAPTPPAPVAPTPPRTISNPFLPSFNPSGNGLDSSLVPGFNPVASAVNSSLTINNIVAFDKTLGINPGASTGSSEINRLETISMNATNLRNAGLANSNAGNEPSPPKQLEPSEGLS